MKKEFDFDDIGKKTPYRVPEGFFDEMQRNVRKHTYGSKPAGHRLWITVSAGIAIAAALVGFLFMPSLFREGDRGGQMLDTGNCTAAAPADKWIREMSDEELEELVSFSESDKLIVLSLKKKKSYESKIHLRISDVPYDRRSVQSLCSKPGE